MMMVAMKAVRLIPMAAALVAAAGGVTVLAAANPETAPQHGPAAPQSKVRQPDWVDANPCTALLRDLRSGTRPSGLISDAGLPERVTVDTTQHIGPRVECSSETADGQAGTITDVIFFDETESTAWVVLGENAEPGYDWATDLRAYGFGFVEPFEHGFVASTRQGAAELRNESSSKSVDLWSAYEPTADLGD